MGGGDILICSLRLTETKSAPNLDAKTLEEDDQDSPGSSVWAKRQL